MTEKSYLAIHGMCVIFLPISPHFVISSTLYIFSFFPIFVSFCKQSRLSRKL